MFAQTETQVMLADMAGRLLADENEFEKRRHRLASAAPDRLALWAVLAGQGILGAGLSEEKGGFGGQARDIATVMEQVGEWLVVEPVLAAFLALHILSRSDAAQAEQLIADIVAGDTVAAIAQWDGPDSLSMPRATISDDRLDGVKPVVRHADLARFFIVAASRDGVPAFALVEAGAPGVSVEPFRQIDGSSAARVTFSQTPCTVLLSGGDAYRDVTALTMLGLAAEAAGICNATNRATFDYLRTRKQFGSPLAGFQALQHRAVDMHIASEELRIAVSTAVEALDAGAAGGAALAFAAKSLADKAGRRVGHEAVQLHGGMGVSDELNVSHYLRRLAAIRAEAGAAADIHSAFVRLSEGAAA
jgi:alkylation response protein AidB-like acyl-CoA dehydrogenase